MRYPAVAKGLAKLPDNTVIDGEIVALDEQGLPSFNILQNYGSAAAPVFYYVFDVMVLRDRKSTRLNSSHSQISYAVFCLKKKKTIFERMHKYEIADSAY